MHRDDVEDAARRIAGRVRRTPLQLLDAGDPWLPAGGCLKLELTQHTGTFKARGAANRILAARERGELDPGVGVVAASGGNAGMANAWAARALGVPATVFVPETSSPVKLRRIESYGATVLVRGTEYADAYAAAVDHVASTGALFCHAYDQPEICAGAGTLGLELLDQLDRASGAVDTVVVAVGGGGLLAGVATALDGRAGIVGVEPTTAPTLHRALEAGGPVDVAVSGVAADSLGARRLGGIAWEVATRVGVRSVLVDDTAIVEARRALWEHHRLAVETGAATALAGLLGGAYLPAPDERVAVVLCGANTDPSDLAGAPA